MNPKDPVALNLFSQKDLIEALEKAERRIKREKKEKEKQNKAKWLIMSESNRHKFIKVLIKRLSGGSY